MENTKALQAIKYEFDRANTLYPNFHSNHEAYAVIKEELDEVWDEIRKSKDIKGNETIKKELIQVGAMVLKYLDNLC
jgi:hypothetical protein